MNKLIIKQEYATVPNDLLNRKDISMAEKGLFAFIQSKPSGWEFSSDRIALQTKESEKTISRMLKKLEEKGYLSRYRFQDKKGYWRVNYILDAYPDHEIPVPRIPTMKIPTPQNPTVGNPTVGKWANNSKKELSNKELSNKEREKSIAENSDLENLTEIRAVDFLKHYYPIRYNETFKEKYKNDIKDQKRFISNFNDTVDIEQLPYKASVLFARLNRYATNWVNNNKNKDKGKV